MLPLPTPDPANQNSKKKLQNKLLHFALSLDYKLDMKLTFNL